MRSIIKKKVLIFTTKRIKFSIIAIIIIIGICGAFYKMINNNDQIKSSKIDLEILHQEKILPVLPLMNHWSTEAFQKPPYSFAGIATTELVSPQDLFYVNDPSGIVVIAKNSGKIVGIAAGLSFDSKDLLSYLESYDKKARQKIIDAGFNLSQLFYLTYILTSQEFNERPLLSHSIFDAVKIWALNQGKKQICWQEDVSYSSNSEPAKVEPWRDDIGGFIKMGVNFKYHWPTRQLDGTIKDTEHMMEFYCKKI